jgi:hypothetical protein
MLRLNNTKAEQCLNTSAIKVGHATQPKGTCMQGTELYAVVHPSRAIVDEENICHAAMAT